jgi:phytoene dehydrogenase-like protein
MNAVMAYMMADWYRPGVTLDFPKGGSGAIVEALVRGLEKAGKGEEGGGRGSGKLMLRTHCEQVPPRHSLPRHYLTIPIPMPQILVRDGRAVGVLLRDQITGKKTEAFATKAVVSNVDFYNLRKLVPIGVSAIFDEALEAYATSVPPLASFIHLHAGIDATDLPTYHNLT